MSDDSPPAPAAGPPGAAATDPEAVVVDYRLEGSVATLRLDNERRLNALNGAMQRQLGAAIARARDDPAVRALVLTGGNRVFASGADITELGRTRPVTIVGPERRFLWDQLESCTKPIVAAVAGYVLGGGCELALGCDLVVAGDTAVLGQPECRLGISPGAGGVQRWGRVVGRFVAAEVAMAGRTLNAWEALRLGLVNRVVPHERTVVAAQRLAGILAAGPPLALQVIKRGVGAIDQMPMAAALDLDRSLMALLLSTDDAREGIDAFTDRRPPRFEGR
jgi:enoyl-CoA hydratase/carnithine racemase